ncbi:MAG TPA: alpha-galactosidase [Phaeodactylibacter sp.]|nr:alpha-galactosidase [Phaeodactylibacter sp.]
MQFVKAVLQYDDKTVNFPFNKMTFFEELYVDFKQTDNGNYQTYHLVIHPKQAIQIKRLALVFDHAYLPNPHTRIFCNGYQSSSESREFALDETIPSLRFWAKKNRQYQGDEHLQMIPRAKGKFHSWTYTYIKEEAFIFAGSLKENAAFTYFLHDTLRHQFTIEKDCHDLELSHSFPILDVFVGKGNEKETFDYWFGEMDLPPLQRKSGIGWTSEQHGSNISEALILKNLNAFLDKKIPLDYFQIDEGYATHLGDWLDLQPSFPNGLATISQKIKQSNYKSGIWLAPFICDAQSKIFTHKKQWLVKDKNGKPLLIGHHQSKGNCYALDFYQSEVQEYLIQVIHVFTKKWGFDFLKLDYLYAVCILPTKNKTRGQILADALEFLKRQLGDKILFANQIPLGSAFGTVDFCSISGNTYSKWENKIERFCGNRERNAALPALRSTLGRWQLNNRVFHNVPTPFILQKEKNTLTPTQQYTALIINVLCGNLSLTSDDIANYSPEQKSEFEYIFQLQKCTIKEVQNLNNDQYIIHFNEGEKKFFAACNLSNKKVTILNTDLQPFETLVRLENVKTLNVKR